MKRQTARIQRTKFNTAARKKDKPHAFGLPFDSALECDRYIFLKSLEQEDVIADLRYKPTYTLMSKFRDGFGHRYRAVKMELDQSYLHKGKLVIEEVKAEDKRKKGQKRYPTATALFWVKWKLLARMFPNVRRRIVTSPTEPVG